MTPTSKTTIAIAGAGDFAKFFVEEALRDGQYDLVVLSRKKPEWFDRPEINFIITDYSEASILSILNSTNSVVLLSFIASLGTAYNVVHESLLAACQKSKSCKRFIPSEFGGDLEHYSEFPRFFAKTRGTFREVLKAQTEVEWTAICCGWFMDYFVPADKSYLKEIPGWWPQDIKTSELCLRGTGNEPQSFTAARDVAKALVKLIKVPDWPNHTYVAGTWCTSNDATKLLESYYGRKFKVLPSKSAASIVGLIEQHKDDEDKTIWIDACLDEWWICGGSAVPREETERQRTNYFSDMKFRTLEELLADAETMAIV